MKKSHVLILLTAVFLFAFGSTAMAKDTAIYKLDEVKDGKVTDESGSNNNASVDGEYKIVDGKFGKAVQFDGDSVSITVPEAVLKGDEFSFAGWVNPKSWKDWSRIFDFGAGADGDAWLGYSGITKKLRLDWFKDPDSAIKIIEVKAPDLNRWTFVAVTANKDKVCLYIDGKLVGSSDANGILAKDIPSTNMYIGKSNWPDPLFKGKMDELYFSDTALTADQVKELMKGIPKK